MDSYERSKKWIYPDSERLWRLAHKIEEKQLWAGYLSEQEHLIWRKALRGQDTWNSFLEGRGEPVETGDGQDTIETVNGATKEEDNTEKIADPVSTAFRARVMLFESSVRDLFPSQTGEESLDFDVDEPSENVDDKKELVIPEKPKTRDIEEDNYDDDDEDEAMDLMVVHVPSSQDADDNIDDIPPLPQIKSFPFDTYYHTFEHDRVAMLELQTVEELNRQNSTEATATHNSLQNVNFGAANLSLKHLLSKIDSKRDALSLSDTELRKLLSDVRKNRSNSKWASDDLIGREELYEALESMLKKLMADKNAYPFLAKVRRMQAPDYYTIIHKPMDLGTMQRNLKTGTYYKSKAHFLEELDWIWQNCLTYNSDPNHPLRPLALAMRNNAAVLADLVPDITIRTRAEVEAEEALAEGEDDAHSEDEKPVKSSRKAGGFSSKGVSQKSGPSMMRGPLHEELENKLLNGVREGSIPISQDGRSSSQVNGVFTTPPPGGTPIGDLEPQLDPAQVAQQAREEGGNDSDEGDVLSLEWSSQTQQARAKYALHRHKLLRKPLGEEEQGLVRTKKGMTKFKEWVDKAYDVVRFKEPEPEPDPEAEDVLGNDEDDAEEDQFLAEYDVACGTLNELTTLYDEESVRELYSPNKVYPELSATDPRIRPPSGGLLDIMRENVRKLGEIRKLCNKVAVIRNMSQQMPGVYQPPMPPLKQQDIDEFAWGSQIEDENHPNASTSSVMNAELARYAMEQAIAKIMFHSGFEDFQPSAFDIITNVAIEYLQGIGRTLRLYINNNNKRTKYSEEELLLHALDLNGVQDLERLDIYIKDDIERYGTKLEDCHRRLKRFLADLLRPALQEGEDGTNIFDDQNESFVSGDFTDELDEDFFGFRELGLDKEFDMISLSVPLRLLQGRMRAVINPAGGEGTQGGAQKDLPEPPPWGPVIPESIEFEIGLVQQFLREKLNSSQESYLIEDENLPQRLRPAKPRLPPTGKISTPRKRKDPPVAGGSAKKKKKPTGGKNQAPEPPVQLPTPPMAVIREEDGSDPESLFG